MASCGRRMANTLGKRRLREWKSHSIGGSALEAAPLTPFCAGEWGRAGEKWKEVKCAGYFSGYFSAHIWVKCA
jgi:hypothetical protein